MRIEEGWENDRIDIWEDKVRVSFLDTTRPVFWFNMGD